MNFQLDLSYVHSNHFNESCGKMLEQNCRLLCLSSPRSCRAPGSTAAILLRSTWVTRLHRKEETFFGHRNAKVLRNSSGNWGKSYWQTKISSAIHLDGKEWSIMKYWWFNIDDSHILSYYIDSMMVNEEVVLWLQRFCWVAERALPTRLRHRQRLASSTRPHDLQVADLDGRKEPVAMAVLRLLCQTAKPPRMMKSLHPWKLTWNPKSKV